MQARTFVTLLAWCCAWLQRFIPARQRWCAKSAPLGVRIHTDLHARDHEDEVVFHHDGVCGEAHLAAPPHRNAVIPSNFLQTSACLVTTITSLCDISRVPCLPRY